MRFRPTPCSASDIHSIETSHQWRYTLYWLLWEKMQCLVHVLMAGWISRLSFFVTMAHFGDFQPICTWTPSYPWCNLFFRQVCLPLYFTFLLLSLVLLAFWSLAGISSRIFRRSRISTCGCQSSMWNPSNRIRWVYFKCCQHRCMRCEYSHRCSPYLSLQPSKSCCWWVSAISEILPKFSIL